MRYIGGGIGHYKQEIGRTAVEVASLELEDGINFELEPEAEPEAEENGGKNNNECEFEGIGNVHPHAQHAPISEGDGMLSLEEHWEDPSGGGDLDSEAGSYAGSEAGEGLYVGEEVSYEY